MPEWTELTRGFYLEGLLVDGDDIWFTDVTRGGVHNLRTGQTVLPHRTMVGGLLLNEGGELLVAGGGGVEWVDPVTGASGMLLTVDDGVNEMRWDGEGGLLFGTIDLPSILKGQTPGPSSIRRLSVDGTMTVLADGFAFANGLTLSPDGRCLYFNESFVASRRFPVGEGLVLGAMETFREMPDCDGMALDVNGNVWLCGFASDYLVCMAPEGEELDRLQLPGPACTNVRFGGADMHDLHVTVVDPADAQKLADGVPITDQNSAMYKMRAPVAGAPIARTRFRLG
jgi:sugar lactone lactonase YvrE